MELQFIGELTQFRDVEFRDMGLNNNENYRGVPILMGPGLYFDFNLFEKHHLPRGSKRRVSRPSIGGALLYC